MRVLQNEVLTIDHLYSLRLDESAWKVGEVSLSDGQAIDCDDETSQGHPGDLLVQVYMYIRLWHLPLEENHGASPSRQIKSWLQEY